jgi:hypothetical protein
MKTIVLGDTHGRAFWKLITHLENPDRVIFIGDYFDSFDISGVEQIHNFKEIINYKETSGKEVILLIGNHDISYYPGINGAAVSGFQFGIAPNITQTLMENLHHLQMAYDDGTYLYSHAGVGKVWLTNQGWDGKENIADFTNMIWKYKPLAFEFYGFESSGDSTTQTPVWIRPASLLKTWQKDKNKPTQIVGHTTVQKIDLEGSKKWTGGKLFMIDALGTSGEYLIIEDGVLRAGKL